MADGVSSVRGSSYKEDDNLQSEDVNVQQKKVGSQSKITGSEDVNSQSDIDDSVKTAEDNLEHIHYTMLQISSMFSELVDKVNPLMKEISDRMQDLTTIVQKLQTLEASIGPSSASNLGYEEDNSWALQQVQGVNSLIQQIATVVDAQKSQWNDKTRAVENLTQTLKDFLDSIIAMTKTLNELYSRLASTIYR